MLQYREMESRGYCRTWELLNMSLGFEIINYHDEIKCKNLILGEIKDHACK